MFNIAIADPISEAKDAYRAKLEALILTYPNRGADHQREKIDAYTTYESVLYEQTGDKTYIHNLQSRMISKIGILQLLYYSKNMNRSDYERRRVTEGIIVYSKKLKDDGVFHSIPDRAWVQSYEDNALAIEASILSPRDSGMTRVEEVDICNQLCSGAKPFFKRLHEVFGVGRIKQEPEIYASKIRDL